MPKSKKLLIREVRLTNTLAHYNKFYEMLVIKQTSQTPPVTTYRLIKRWGRLDSNNHQNASEVFASNSQAQDALDGYKRVTMAKGYLVEFDRSGVPVQKPLLRFKKEMAGKDELPKGSTFDLSGDEEAKTWSDVVAKRKDEAEW